MLTMKVLSLLWIGRQGRLPHAGRSECAFGAEIQLRPNLDRSKPPHVKVLNVTSSSSILTISCFLLRLCHTQDSRS